MADLDSEGSITGVFLSGIWMTFNEGDVWFTEDQWDAPLLEITFFVRENGAEDIVTMLLTAD